MGLYEQHYLAHHGVKGMKWGVRRYQNEDGTLTDEGKKHYADLVISASKRSTAFDDLGRDYVANETPLMKKKRQQLSKLYDQEYAIRNKLDRDLDNMEAEAVRKYMADGKIDKEWGAQYNARMKELKATAKAELKSVQEDQKKLVKDWTNEFLGKYANRKVTEVFRGESYTVNAGKEFASMFKQAAWGWYK